MKYIYTLMLMIAGLIQVKAQSGRAAWDAVRRDDTAVISLWIQSGMSADTGFWQDRTLLHMCVFLNRYKTAQWLLNLHVSSDIQDADGMTALHWAVSRGDLKMTAIFLAHHPNLRLVNSRGESLLHLAAIHQNIALARILIQSGADKYIRDKYDLQPVDYAFDPNLRGLLYTGEK